MTSLLENSARRDWAYTYIRGGGDGGDGGLASLAQHQQGDGPTSLLGPVSMGKEQSAECKVQWWPRGGYIIERYEHARWLILVSHMITHLAYLG